MHIQNPRKVIRRRPVFSLGSLGDRGGTSGDVTSGYYAAPVQIVAKPLSYPATQYLTAEQNTLLHQLNTSADAFTPIQQKTVFDILQSQGITSKAIQNDIEAGQRGDLAAKARALAAGVNNDYFFVKKHDWADFISDKIVPGIIQAVVVTGITAGVGSAFGVGPLAQGGSLGPTDAAKTAASAGQNAAASDAGMLSAPISSTPAAVSAATTAASTATTAGTAVQYLKTAKDILGVASAIKAAVSAKPAAQDLAPSLDSSYGGGSGSGGGAGGSGSAPSLLTQLTSGNMPLYIGGGILAFITFTLLATRNSAPRARRRR